MLVVIAHNAVSSGAREDEQDVLVQAAEVEGALRQLGHDARLVPVSLDLEAFVRRLQQWQPAVVFNLIESLAGSDRSAALAAAVIEQAGFALTGSGADSLWVSNHKVVAKQALSAAGLPTPAWYASTPWHDDTSSAAELAPTDIPPSPWNWAAGTRFIIKPVFEHASLGMDASAVVTPSGWQELAEAVTGRARTLQKPCFAERFVDGREFNVSLLANDRGCEVLPLAEIDFADFPAGKVRIVDYEAKWDASSFAFHHTPRKFVTAQDEPELSAQLANLARRCWFVFELGGYVRVDFRIDADGQPWILELNTNPCLSPDAGFRAALRQGSVPFADAVARILQDALRTPTRARPDGVPSGGRLPAQVASFSAERGAIQWRDTVQAADPQLVEQLVAATGFFYPDEVTVAGELVSERLTKGEVSGYYFLFAESQGELLGYACYGPIACTRDAFDLYWIAVDPRRQRGGIGQAILQQAEAAIRDRGGRQVYIETSNRPQYLSTRAFYLRCGYEVAATLPEFYGPGDDKVIYVRRLT
ncbi:MAG: GNAT family N-acetyltransferase [Pirellulaceae bacterium]